jgi:hypothetical protein
MQLFAWAYSKGLSTNYPIRYYYKKLKKDILEDALEQPEELGDLIFMSFKDKDSGIEYRILIKRKWRKKVDEQKQKK